MIRIPLLTGLVFSSLAAGCGTLRSWEGVTSLRPAGEPAAAETTRPWDGLASRFRKSDPESDSLILDKNALSEGFRKARGGFTSKGLKNPEATNLAFARWKEDMGQYAEAKQRYHEVLTANPDCLTARLGIARIERETGRYDQCREILMAAREQHPESPTVMLELGRMYKQREQWDDSIRAFSQAVNLAPDDQMVRYELGLALASADRVQEALPHLKFAVGQSAAFYNIGFLLHERGRSAEAVSWIERTMEAHPDERTRRMAMELLAELDTVVPRTPTFIQPNTAVAASQASPRRRPVVQPAPRQSHTVGRMPSMDQPRIEAHPAVATRTITPSPAVATPTVSPSAMSPPPAIATRPLPTPAAAPRIVSAPSAASSDSIPVSGVVTYNPTPDQQSDGSVAPPQWSGPRQSQSQWTRSTQHEANAIQPAGHSQTAADSEITDPPLWHRQ